MDLSSAPFAWRVLGPLRQCSSVPLRPSVIDAGVVAVATAPHAPVAQADGERRYTTHAGQRELVCFTGSDGVAGHCQPLGWTLDASH